MLAGLKKKQTELSHVLLITIFAIRISLFFPIPYVFPTISPCFTGQPLKFSAQAAGAGLCDGGHGGAGGETGAGGDAAAPERYYWWCPRMLVHHF